MKREFRQQFKALQEYKEIFEEHQRRGILSNPQNGSPVQNETESPELLKAAKVNKKICF